MSSGIEVMFARGNNERRELHRPRDARACRWRNATKPNPSLQVTESEVTKRQHAAPHQVAENVCWVTSGDPEHFTERLDRLVCLQYGLELVPLMSTRRTGGW
jgi:hypothetical protein